MTKETFLHFVSSPYYANGGWVHTNRQKFTFQTYEILDDCVDFHNYFHPPIPLASIRALSVTHKKSRERISAYSKPTIH